MAQLHNAVSASPGHHTRAGTGRMGWRLVWANLVVAGLTVAAILAAYGTGLEGIRMFVRVTPRPALFFFLAAFVATPLRRVWRAPVSAWLVRERRYLGVSFAVWHLVHMVGLIVLAIRSAEFRGDVGMLTLTVGGGGFVVLILMVVTSFDRTAAWVGRRAWRILHTTGMFWLWVIFTDTYRGRLQTRDEWFDGVFVALLVAAMLLRIGSAVVVRVRRRTRMLVQA